MTALGWIVFAGFAILVLAAVRGLVYIWRGESAVWDHRPAWWPWGEQVFRAWVRVMPIGVATLAVLDAIYLAKGLGVYDAEGRLVYWACAALALSLLALFLLATTVAFYNRPSWVVPPHLRDEPGIVASQEEG